MSAHVYGPPRRRKAVVNHSPAMKPWHRAAEQRMRERIPLADWIDDTKANLLRKLALMPATLPKAAWRHRDHWAAPVLGLPLLPMLLFLSAIQPWHRVPRFFEILGSITATGVVCWFFAQEHHAAQTERAVRDFQTDLDSRVDGLTCVAVQKRDHATIGVCSVNWGHEPAQYEANIGKLTNSYRSPVFITNESPGRLELRIQHEDLLAKPALWTPHDEGRPDKIPFGHDWDKVEILLNLLYSSLLIAGVRGSGKSAALNALIAHLVSMLHVELYIIDPLEGIDLGRWWPFAKEVADTEEMGIKLIEHFEDLRCSRVRSMRHSGRGVQLARWSAKWPMRVLVIDELATLTLRGTRQERQRTGDLLHGIASKGRKSDDCLVVATQHPSVEVIPQLVRGQMTNVLGLRMARREQARQVFGDGVVADWDLSKIPADRPGQGVFFNGTTYRMCRVPGLFGADLRRQVHLLDQARKARLADDADDEAGLTSDPERAGEKEGLTNVGEADADRVNELRDVLPADGSTVLYADIRARLPQIPKASLDRMLAKRDGVAQRVSRGVYRRRP